MEKCVCIYNMQSGWRKGVKISNLTANAFLVFHLLLNTFGHLGNWTDNDTLSVIHTLSFSNMHTIFENPKTSLIISLQRPSVINGLLITHVSITND